MLQLKDGVDLVRLQSDEFPSEEGAIFTDLNTGRYIKINQTSLVMVEELLNTPSREQVIHNLLERFDVDSNILKQDLNEFIQQLTQLDLMDGNFDS